MSKVKELPVYTVIKIYHRPIERWTIDNRFIAIDTGNRINTDP